MSLFKSIEWRSALHSSDEECDFGCLCVGDITNAHDGSEQVAVGNYAGLLRIYSPSKDNQAAANDLLLESKLAGPILQLASGRYVSVSKDVHLAVLQPRSISVYSIDIKKGAVDHGNQAVLNKVYEHKLERTSANFTSGPFGGVREKELICVQSMDGTISIFDSENFVFMRFIPGFGMPGPLAYCAGTDSFLTVSSNRQLESYSYQVLAVAASSKTKEESQSVTSGKRIKVDWQLSLGECALDIRVVTIPSAATVIMVLGERNLYCVEESGQLKYMKKLGYSPACFHPYVPAESSSVNCVVATHSKQLLVYEGIIVKWATLVDDVPVHVCLGNISGNEGLIVTLTDSCRVSCNYLGTHPSIFSLPRSNAREMDQSAIDKEMLAVNDRIRKLHSTKKDDIISKNRDTEDIKVKIDMPPTIDRVSVSGPDAPPSVEGQVPSITVQIMLKALRRVNNVSVMIHVDDPLMCTQNHISIPSIDPLIQDDSDFSSIEMSTFNVSVIVTPPSLDNATMLTGKISYKLLKQTATSVDLIDAMIEEDSASHDALMEEVNKLLDQFMRTVDYEDATVVDADYFSPMNINGVNDDFVVHFNVVTRESNVTELVGLLEKEAELSPNSTLSFIPDSIDVGTQRSFFAEFELINSSEPVGTYLEGAETLKYTPVVDSLFGDELPGLDGEKIESAKIWRVFNDDGMTRVQVNVTMSKNVDANPFEMTRTFREALRNASTDELAVTLEDDETVFMEAENFNITVLPSTPKAHRALYTGQFVFPTLLPNVNIYDVCKDSTSDSFEITKEQIEEELDNILNAQDSLTVQYFAPNIGNDSAPGIIAHFVVTSPFSTHDSEFFEEELKDKSEYLSYQFVPESVTIPTAREFFFESVLDYEDADNIKSVDLDSDSPNITLSDTENFNDIVADMIAVASGLEPDRFTVSSLSAVQVDKDKVRIVASIDCPENYNGDPFTLTERIREELNATDGHPFTFRDDANVTTLLDEQDSYDFTGQLTFANPLEVADQSDILTACRDNESMPFEMFENMTEEILNRTAAENALSYDVQYFSPVFENDTIAGLTAHFTVQYPTYQPTAIESLIRDANHNVSDDKLSFNNESVVVPSQRDLFYEAFVTFSNASDVEPVLAMNSTEWDSFRNSVEPIISNDLAETLGTDEFSFTLNEIQQDGDQLKIVGLLSLPENDPNEPFTITPGLRSNMDPDDNSTDDYYTIDDTNVNITSYVIKPRPVPEDDTSDDAQPIVVTGYYNETGLSHGQIVHLYQDPNSTLARTIKDKVKAPLLDNDSNEPWLDDVVVEYFEDTPDPEGPVKVHFKLLLPPDSNLTDDEINEIIPDGYEVGDEREFIGELLTRGTNTTEEDLEEFKQAIDKPEAVTNVTKTTESDLSRIKFTLTLKPNDSSLAPQLQDLARSNVDSETSDIDPDSIVVRVPGPYLPPGGITADGYIGRFTIPNVSYEDIVACWNDSHSDTAKNITRPYFEPLKNLNYSVELDYLEPGEDDSVIAHVYLHEMRKPTNEFEMYAALLSAMENSNHTLENLAIGGRRQFAGHVTATGGNETEDEIVTKLQNATDMIIDTFAADEIPNLPYWQNVIDDIMDRYSEYSSRRVSRSASGSSDENLRVVQFKILDETNKRAMPRQVYSDLDRAIRENEIAKDLDTDTLQAYVIPPKARGEEFDVTLLIDTDAPENFTQNKPFIEDFTAEFLRDMVPYVIVGEPEVEIYKDQETPGDDWKKNSGRVRVKVTAPWGAFTPDELQNEIRNNISDPIENDVFTMAEDDIFVGLYNPCDDNLMVDCDERAACDGNRLHQNFTCECRPGFKDISELFSQPPGRTCSLDQEEQTDTSLVYILIVLAALMVFVIVALVYASYLKYAKQDSFDLTKADV